MSSISVLDPILRVRVGATVEFLGLHGVLGHISAGTPLDLLGLHQTQRPHAVTFLAVVMAVAARHGASPATAGEWRDWLDDTFGSALTLVGGPDDRPQFLQPVLQGIRMGEIKPIAINEVDATFPATRHVLKDEILITPERAFYALVSSEFRPNGGLGHWAGIRSNVVVVLPGIDADLGSEVRHLRDAYSRHVPVAVGRRLRGPGTAAAHFLFMAPHEPLRPLDAVPYPVWGYRLIRLVAVDGRIEAVKANPAVVVKGKVVLKGKRPVMAGDQRPVQLKSSDGELLLEDPHVPTMKAGPLRLFVRSFSARLQHDVVAGSVVLDPTLDRSPRPAIHRAPILGTGTFNTLRISGMRLSANCLPGGVYTALYRVASTRAFQIGGGDRVSALSKQVLTAMALADRIFYGPAITAFDGDKKTAERYERRMQDSLRDRTAQASLQLLLDLLGNDPDGEAEITAINAFAAGTVHAVWTAAYLPVLPLALARATFHLTHLINRDFPGVPMADTYFDHPFRRGVYASLARMNASLTSDMRARVRGSGSMLPIQVVHALATLPVSETDSFDRRPVWEIALRAFGTVVHGNGSVGSVLAQTDYPEARVNALLASRGDQTVRLVSEVSRWLVARDVYAVDLTSLVVMALAEIDGDMRLHRMASGSIALDYARVIAARKRAAA